MSEALRLAKGLARRFAFGPHEPEDIVAYALAYALEAWPRYSAANGPVGPFVRVHMVNKLRTFRRQAHWRNEPPCPVCDGGGRCAAAVAAAAESGRDGPCRRHVDWLVVQGRKASLNHSFGAAHDDLYEAPNAAAFGASLEEVPARLRELALAMVEGYRPAPSERAAVEELKTLLCGSDV